MSLRNLVLIGGAIAIFAAGLYLFVQVRATPAQAEPGSSDRVSARPSPVAEHTPETAPDVKLARPIPGPPNPTYNMKPATTTPTTAGTPDQATEDTHVDLKTDNMMELANKAYDRQDFDEAIAIAGKMLSKDPTNTRMLRVMVSSQCIQGDSAVAQQYWEKLPKFDRDQMKQRCDRYGVTFKEPAQ